MFVKIFNTKIKNLYKIIVTKNMKKNQAEILFSDHWSQSSFRIKNYSYLLLVYLVSLNTDINTFTSQRLVFEEKINHFFLKMHQI